MPVTEEKGEFSLVVGYGGKNASIAIAVNENTLSTITVSGIEDTYNYGDVIDFSAFTINLRYIDGSTVPMSYDEAVEAGLTVSNIDTTKVGATEITFVLQGKTRTYDIEILDPIGRIEIDNANRYFELKKDSDATEIRSRIETLAIKAVRYSGAYDMIPFTSLNIDYADIDVSAASAEMKYFTVSYMGFSTEIPYKVVDAMKYKKLVIDESSTFKTLYLPGESLVSLDTLKVRAILSADDSSTDVIGSDNLLVTGYDAVDLNTAGVYTLIITYTDEGGNSIAARLDVEVCSIVSLSLSGFATEIARGDAFDTTSASFDVTIVYSNGTSITFKYADRYSQPILADKLVVVNSVNPDTPGRYGISVEYLGVQKLYDVGVKNNIVPDTDGDSNVTEKAPL